MRLFKLLVVDDDEDVLDVFRVLFEKKEGIDIETAQNGADALKKILENNYDYVVSDTNMPKMDGVELLKKSLVSRPKIKFCLMFSGLNGSDLTKGDILKFGADGVVAKPEALEFVTKRINELRLDSLA